MGSVVIGSKPELSSLYTLLWVCQAVVQFLYLHVVLIEDYGSSLSCK
jgi:hypothetical protein